MIAVFFEVTPAPGLRETYLALAAGLAAQLSTVDGFVSIERFESLARPGTLLSLSLWRDEAAVQAWRDQAAHRAAQHEGRTRVFERYVIRTAQVLREREFTR